MKKDLTTEAVKNQLRAMGCEKYEISIRDEKSGKNMIREWGPDEVVGSIGWLKRMNVTGNHIYIRPAANTKNNLVLVDDVDGATIEEMREAGHNPACIVETSPKNYQAWIKFDSDGLSDERRRELSKILAQRYGADRASVGQAHPGRLAGFTNRKPEHEKYGQQPWSLLRHSSGKPAVKGGELIKEADLAIEREQAHDFQEDRWRAATFFRPNPFVKPEVEYSRQLDRIMRAQSLKNQRVDISAADFGAACELYKQGYSREQIDAAMKKISKNVDDRKRGHLQDYCRRTLDAAEKHPDVQRVQKNRQRQQEERQRPSQTPTIKPR